MKELITRLFDTYEDAARAVDALKRSGIPEADISIVANRDSYRDTDYVDTANGDATVNADTSEAGTGAGIGGTLGAGVGLLTGIGILAIPGLGPVVAAGWLAATAVGAVAGAVGGGVIGAMVDSGVPEADAHVYAEGVRRGGTLVTVRTEQPASAYRILDNYTAVDIAARRSRYAETGWREFDSTDAR